MNLSIVIINWNTRELLENCLRSVFATAHDLSLEVIVLDNASTDGSAQMVATTFPQVKLIQSQENLGFAGGNNIAIRQATADYILLLNPDTEVLDGAVRQLCEALQSWPSLGGVGAQLLNPDGSAQMSWGRFPSLWTELPLLNRLTRAAPQSLASNGHQADNPPLSVDWVSGAALMLRCKTLAQVGLLDEDYWLYTEETDWCYRAHEAGWKIGWLPDAQVIHVAGAASRQRYAETMLHFHRSRLLFMQKHRGAFQARCAQMVLCVKAALWLVVPRISPLSMAFADLSAPDMRRAYRKLLRGMLVPVI